MFTLQRRLVLSVNSFHLDFKRRHIAEQIPSHVPLVAIGKRDVDFLTHVIALISRAMPEVVADDEA